MQQYKLRAACKILNKDALDIACRFLNPNPYNNLIPTYGVEYDTEKRNIEYNSAKYLNYIFRKFLDQW